MDVENDIAVVRVAAQPRQRGVRRHRAVELQAAEAALQIACVGEGQRFGDLDDEAALDELELVVWSVFRVLETVRAWDSTEDLDPWASRVLDDGEEREADADGDAEG